MEPESGRLDVSELARSQQLRNARIISLALALLSTAGAVLTWAVGHPLSMGMVVLVPALGMGAALLLVQKGHLGGATSLLLVSIFVQHIAAVWVPGFLGPTPFVAPVAILLTAATSRSRSLPFALVGCLVTIAIEGALVPWTPINKGILGTAGILAIITFVVSLLHTRGVERAFAVAEEQARSRESTAQAALESERRFRLLAETADDLIAIIQVTGETVFMSDSHERLFGVPLSTLSQGRFTDHLEVENLEEVNELVAQAVVQGNAHFELRVLVPGKGRVLLDVRVRPIEWQSETLLAIISRDVTQQRALQERLHSSERLEALGRLAGSVAHDFNNLLTVIQGSTEIAASKVPANSSLHPDLDAVLSASHMAADLARQLLTFSRRQLVVREPIDVGAILLQQESILRRLLGNDIALEFDLMSDLPMVTIPKAHIEQLAMNFATNARDAMPQGGKFRMATRVRRLRDREVVDLTAGDYVELRLEDTGAGIPVEVLDRLFEPFFSTKGSRGTGLGLATCQAIATQAGGAIAVESTLSQGTTFSVLLPVSQQPEAVVETPVFDRELRRVLLVDDDRNVRQLVTRMLQAEGLEVLSASSSSEAFARLEDSSVALDALITDVVLGEERGTDLLLKTRRARPNMRILVISGYTPEPEAMDALAEAGASFLPKPFGRDQLRSALLSAK